MESLRSAWVAMALVMCLSMGGCSGSGMTAAELDQRISARVTVGMDPRRVLAVLDSMGIEHSEYEPKTRSVMAVVPDKRQFGRIVTRSLHIAFRFDSAGTLTSHSVSELFTGP